MIWAKDYADNNLELPPTLLPNLSLVLKLTVPHFIFINIAIVLDKTIPYLIPYLIPSIVILFTIIASDKDIPYLISPNAIIALDKAIPLNPVLVPNKELIIAPNKAPALILIIVLDRVTLQPLL